MSRIVSLRSLPATPSRAITRLPRQCELAASPWICDSRAKVSAGFFSGMRQGERCKPSKPILRFWSMRRTIAPSNSTPITASFHSLRPRGFSQAFALESAYPVHQLLQLPLDGLAVLRSHPITCRASRRAGKMSKGHAFLASGHSGNVEIVVIWRSGAPTGGSTPLPCYAPLGASASHSDESGT